MSKKELGQYFTVSNPFTLKPFTDWLHSIPSYESLKYIEPFAGENNIPNMIDGSVAKDLDWSCFDIEPKPTNRYSKAQIQKRDTVLDFPKGYDVAITNPPYLAKNSAKRLKLAFPDTKYDDIYKQCLDTMLANVGYVAAIIPETYIISGLFHKRLNSVISLTCRMFDDTECPVCLAMFNKDESDDFTIYRLDELVGTYSEIINTLPRPHSRINWKFNDKAGEVGIVCIDDSVKPSIRFVKGETIDPKSIKDTSRSITRLSGLPEDIQLDGFLDRCNVILGKYRDSTKDVLMASFKGLREDSYYRRRLDFKTARMIMNQCIDDLRQ